MQKWTTFIQYRTCVSIQTNDNTTLTVLPIPALSVAHDAGSAIINMADQEQNGRVPTSPEPVPSHSAPDAVSSSAGVGAQQAPSGGLPAPPQAHPSCFWSHDYALGHQTAINQQSFLELQFFLTFLRDISAEHVRQVPVCVCDPGQYPADYQKGFLAGCEKQNRFLKGMMRFELQQLQPRMEVQMLEYRGAEIFGYPHAPTHVGVRVGQAPSRPRSEGSFVHTR